MFKTKTKDTTVDGILIGFYTIKEKLLDLIENKVIEEDQINTQVKELEEKLSNNIEEQKKAKTAINQLNKILGYE